MRFCLILITALLLAGCSHHKAPPPNARLSDSITVIAGLNDQLQSWHGTPYRYGGMTRRGVDCSGFVVVTMRDRFDLQLPRETKQQASIGTQIDKDELLPFQQRSGLAAVRLQRLDGSSAALSDQRSCRRSLPDSLCR